MLGAAEGSRASIRGLLLSDKAKRANGCDRATQHGSVVLNTNQECMMESCIAASCKVRALRFVHLVSPITFLLQSPSRIALGASSSMLGMVHMAGGGQQSKTRAGATQQVETWLCGGLQVDAPTVQVALGSLSERRLFE